MAPVPTKKYQLVGGSWSSQHLELQHDGRTFLWVNAKTRIGIRQNPYITIHENAQSGPIVAAAKMGVTGWQRDFRIFVGNPDCTDLNVWPRVKCKGRWAHEYQFCIDGQQFAWKRTRDKRLGSLGNGHQDFKLVALGPAEVYDIHEQENVDEEGKRASRVERDDEKEVGDLEAERNAELRIQPRACPLEERVMAIYVHNSAWIHSQRTASITFFEDLPKTTEIWALAAVLGLQEKISKNKNCIFLASIGYGGVLRPLGAYM